jgi:hypothetical protein
MYLRAPITDWHNDMINLMALDISANVMRWMAVLCLHPAVQGD